MRKNIHIILLLMLLMLPACGFADEAAIQITMTSGEKYIFTFAEEPVITPSGDWITITTNDNSKQPVILSFSDIADITPSIPDASGIEGIIAGCRPNIKWNGTSFTITAAKAPVCIYDISGQMTSTIKPDAEGNVIVDVSSLPPSTYIIKSGSLTLKISKK